jgi:hypothetical protein
MPTDAKIFAAALLSAAIAAAIGIALDWSNGVIGVLILGSTIGALAIADFRAGTFAGGGQRDLRRPRRPGVAHRH